MAEPDGGSRASAKHGEEKMVLFNRIASRRKPHDGCGVKALLKDMVKLTSGAVRPEA
jgi:hypothetical protein